jgi:hypothetical protein
LLDGVAAPFSGHVAAGAGNPELVQGNAVLVL